MRSTGFAAALFLVACAAVSEAQAPKTEELLVGTWNCSSNSNGAVITGPMTFVAGGKSKVTSNVAIPDATIEMTGTGNGTWKLLPDGTLEEVVTDFKVATAKTAGQPSPVEDMQAMIDAMVVNVPVISTFKLEPKSLVRTDQSGGITSCSR
ncbi:MAG: hypothetical protein Q8R02_17410 [Hyphomonadaceae bacterium]|nr:hypothetical protein [Hyphomonadaceae bacterium]